MDVTAGSQDDEEADVVKPIIEVQSSRSQSTSKTTSEVRIYGRDPKKQVKVVHKCESDPSKMLKGMEEFLFKRAAVINFGDPKTSPENLHLAILAKDSFNHHVF